MERAILATLVALFLLMTPVYADWCSGDTLVRETVFGDNGDIHNIQKNFTCELGCDSYNAACIMAEDYMPPTLFILFEIIGFASVFAAFFRNELIFPLVSMVMFFMLAAVSFLQNPTTGLTLMALNLGFGLLSLVILFVKNMLHIKDEIEQEDKELMG